jgi:predicted DNA-binding transcriptional regulator YafY
MRRADRLFQIIQYLRSRRVTTAKWLAEALEVSERTIYRDIQDLAASGTPIEGEAGVGYVLRKGYNLPPLMFNKDEIAALTLGVRLVKSWADPKLASAAEQVLSKVGAVLPDHRKTDLHEARLFAPLTLISAAVSTTMGCIRPAIDSQNKLRFNYTRQDGKHSSRTVWPLGLFFWGSVWTLGAWCELRSAFRIFRLDRIHDLQLCSEHYEQTVGRTLEAMIELEKENMQQDQCKQ